MLLINVDFESLADRDDFISHFQLVAAHCALHEPRTLGYELSIDDKDPTKIIIYERRVHCPAECRLPGAELKGNIYADKLWARILNNSVHAVHNEQRKVHLSLTGVVEIESVWGCLLLAPHHSWIHVFLPQPTAFRGRTPQPRALQGVSSFKNASLCFNIREHDPTLQAWKYYYFLNVTRHSRLLLDIMRALLRNM